VTLMRATVVAAIFRAFTWLLSFSLVGFLMGALLTFLLRVAGTGLARLFAGLIAPMLFSLGIDRERLPSILQGIAARVGEATAPLEGFTPAELDVVEGAVEVLLAIRDYFRLSTPRSELGGFLAAIAERVIALAPPEATPGE
jgi:hypothetical protein